jgi:hypothetical protein
VSINYQYLVKILIIIYEDKRNWPEYNEQLVRRGWFYLSTGFLELWDRELEDMNQGKNGRPFKYPETFIQLIEIDPEKAKFIDSFKPLIYERGLERLYRFILVAIFILARIMLLHQHKRSLQSMQGHH